MLSRKYFFRYCINCSPTDHNCRSKSVLSLHSVLVVSNTSLCSECDMIRWASSMVLYMPRICNYFIGSSSNKLCQRIHNNSSVIIIILNIYILNMYFILKYVIHSKGYIYINRWMPCYKMTTYKLNVNLKISNTVQTPYEFTLR